MVTSDVVVSANVVVWPDVADVVGNNLVVTSDVVVSANVVVGMDVVR